MTWMSTIARNRALDEARKRRPDSPSDSETIDALIDQTSDATERLGTERDLQRLMRCLEELGEDKSLAVRLAYLDGYTRQELAGRFSLPVNTIKTWLHRSLKQLKKCLES